MWELYVWIIPCWLCYSHCCRQWWFISSWIQLAVPAAIWHVPNRIHQNCYHWYHYSPMVLFIIGMVLFINRIHQLLPSKLIPLPFQYIPISRCGLRLLDTQNDINICQNTVWAMGVFQFSTLVSRPWFPEDLVKSLLNCASGQLSGPFPPSMWIQTSKMCQCRLNHEIWGGIYWDKQQEWDCR